ncbi:MAG: AAA family ATPase [Chromatiales bacterium]|nr:AAA family ATPase [Chromatiales bacterium]
MTKFEIFRRQASVGAHVTLRLTRGSDVTGRVTELDDAYIRLDREEGPVTVLEDLLAAWEVHRGDIIDDPMDRAGATHSRPDADADGTQAPPATTPVVGPPDTAPEVLQELARVKAELSVTLDRARPVPPEPDFRFPETEFPANLVQEVRREWDRARNQYDYATKVRETSRLNSVVAQILMPLQARHPGSATTRALLGTVLLKLDRRSEALDHLSAAAVMSNEPARWLTLAAAGEDTSVECYALRRHFLRTPPVPGEDPWPRYIAVAMEHHDLRQTARIIRHWHGQAEADATLRRLLCESVIYLLFHLEAEALVLRATALMQTSSELPPGWVDAFDDSASPSAELVAAERRFDRPPAPTPDRESPPHSPAGSPDVPSGRIVSFGNLRFGFINAPAGDHYYFRIGDIEDEDLRDALLDGRWRTFGPVEFELLPPVRGHKYERAISIRPLLDGDPLLQRARRMLRVGQPAQAMHEVRRALGADPTDEAALRLEREVKENIRKGLREGAGLPEGRGPYARAKRAQLADLDLDAAEKLLKQAIRERDKLESAVKDLASLLNQQGRVDEAIALLEDKSQRAKDASSYDNMLATLYEHTNRHDDAVRILERLYPKTPRAKRNSLLIRIASSHLRVRKYDAAEVTLRKLLNDDPHNRTALRLIGVLENARNAESQDAAEEVIGDLGLLTDEGVVLSALARTAIEQCTYEGVDPIRVKEGTADEREIARVVGFAKDLGKRRPRERAAYYLSAAALLNRVEHEDGSRRIYDYLRTYFTSMADASWMDGKSADVVRSYYIESLALVVNVGQEDWRNLIRYLATFSPGMQQDAEAIRALDNQSRSEFMKNLEKSLESITSPPEKHWLDGLVAVGSQSHFAEKHLGDAFLRSKLLGTRLGQLLGNPGPQAENLRETWESRCREYARQHRSRLYSCKTMTRYAATAASMEDLRMDIDKAAEETGIALDRQRLNKLGDIVDFALAFCRATEFEERERNYRLVTERAEDIIREIQDAPTQYSHEGLLPVADHVNSVIEEEYAEMNRTSGADLHLRLMVDNYLPGPQGDLRLQFAVSNRTGCSPASSVRIRLGPDDSEYFRADPRELEITSTLRGGQTHEAQMVVYPQDAAVRDRAFPITATARYRNRLGEDKHTADHAWTVGLYRDEEFQHLENPYEPFAEGGPVDDPDMFFGRDALLSRLETSLRSRSGRKSIVMFGQKRAGKSSIVEHLRRRLAESDDVLPVSFSLQEFVSDLSEAALLHRIVHGISEVLEDLRLEGRDVPKLSPPRIDEMHSNATLRFHQVMSGLVREMNRRSSVLHIVLLIDEFTEIFKAIRNERIPREFMKAWKATIEKGYFSSVLVGQDIMPAFKAAFPNEFGVTEDIRVTYLDEAAARALVQRPIGEERFAGDAVRRLLELTANSPYYTMMFCARLVDYMNATRSMVVTAADILTVKNHMLLGDDRRQDDRRLTADKFDNLLAAGDGVQDSGIDPDDTQAVCAAIARTGGEGWCARESMSDIFEPAKLDMLLSDLEDRDVVERKGTAYRLRVGLFRDWLRLRGSTQ